MSEPVEPPPPDETPAPTPEQVHALALTLATNAEQYAAAADAERRQEVDTDDVFHGPYDPRKAVSAMTEINREVIAAEADWKRSKEETATLKKNFDTAVHRMIRIVQRYDELARRSPGNQPYLRAVAADEETIGHRQRRLALQLAESRQCFVTLEQLNELTREHLETLDLWITKPGPVPPAFIASHAHIAGVAGVNGAHCTKCGTRIDGTYPAGAFVGLDCDAGHELVHLVCGTVLELKSADRGEGLREDVRWCPACKRDVIEPSEFGTEAS